MVRPDPNRPEVRLVVSARSRAPSRVHALPWPDDAVDPPIDALVARLADAPDAWGWTLSGGEPTLRPDLPDLVRALVDAGAQNPGLATDGLVLARPGIARALADWGVTRVRVGLHSARPDAHDWLVGIPGATRAVRKGVEAAVAAGLAVELETVITRPVMPHLEEIVLLGSALGARTLHLCRPWLDGPGAAESVTLSPRFGLLQPYLEGAAQAARRRGLHVALHDLPRCAAPSRDRERVRPGTERWLVPAGWEAVLAGVQRAQVPGCADCPADCPGAPADYVLRFGRTEFDSQGAPGEPPDPEAPGVPVPAPRAGWTPATRVADARLRARAGRPERDPGDPREVLELALEPDASTRAARVALVRAAQQRPKVLRLVGGWLEHDKAAGLLAESRYFDPEVVAVGPADRLASLPDRALTRLGRLVRVEAVLFAPQAADHDRVVGREGAFAATLALLPRLRTAGIQAELVADPRKPASRATFETAWADGSLPGSPRWATEPTR